MKHFQRIKLTFAERCIAVAILVVTLHLSFPQFSHAASPIEQPKEEKDHSVFVIPLGEIQRDPLEEITAPIAEEFPEPFVPAPKKKARRTLWVLVTAYSSTPDQTDGSPFITAKNTFVRDGVVAANFLSFNTRLRIPQHFGDKEFFVEDRMHERFSNRIDLWMPTRADAKKWGAKWVKVEIL